MRAMRAMRERNGDVGAAEGLDRLDRVDLASVHHVVRAGLRSCAGDNRTCPPPRPECVTFCAGGPWLGSVY
jgi:hypothetical protein